MENKITIELEKRDILFLKDLRELCIDDDLLDLPAYDSIMRADKIDRAWKALKVIEEIEKRLNN